MRGGARAAKDEAIEVYEQIVERGGAGAHAERVAAMRRTFEARTGSFGPEDAWFEARSRAFWDDALTRQGFTQIVAAELPRQVSPWVFAFERAHRGLFHATQIDAGWMLRDVWSGAEFLIETADESLREALHAASGLFDARLVGSAPSAMGQASEASEASEAFGAAPAPPSPLRIAILPGAIFHADEATDSIDEVIRVARGAGLKTDDLLDALLRMDRSFRALSRVKARYAYRPEALKPIPQ